MCVFRFPLFFSCLRTRCGVTADDPEQKHTDQSVARVIVIGLRDCVEQAKALLQYHISSIEDISSVERETSWLNSELSRLRMQQPFDRRGMTLSWAAFVL